MAISLKTSLPLARKNVRPLNERKPRYVRVNTLKKTCDEVIKYFRSEGWELIPPLNSYKEFLQSVRNLTESQFLRDFHLKNVLVFPPRTEFFQHEFYQNGTVILQDKASCLPPYVLNPDPDSTALDVCAAPGMKTSMLSALMKGKGQIYAIEISNRRFKTLESMVQLAGCENVHTIEGDALQVYADKHPWCNDVEYILVDPTCSGTGMTERAKLFTATRSDEEQLRKLTAFQRLLLIHALTNFPSARRVVYSTCSIKEEENEAVISSVLERFEAPCPWKVVTAFPDWESRGSKNYSFGLDCITASPSFDLTTGFFIAALERTENIKLGETGQETKMAVNDLEISSPMKRKREEELEGKEVLNSKLKARRVEGSGCKILNEKSFKEVCDSSSNNVIDKLTKIESEEGLMKTNENKKDKSKKKRKNKHPVCEDSLEVTTTSIQPDSFVFAAKRKKEKKEIVEDENDKLPNENKFNEGKSTKIKKRKHKYPESEDLLDAATISIDSDSFERTVKRKKEKKELVEDENEKFANDNALNKDKLKKKKKRKNDQPDCDTLDAATTVGTDSFTHKTKHAKEKKEKVGDENEKLINDNTLNKVKLKKKKKREHYQPDCDSSLESATISIGKECDLSITTSENGELVCGCEKKKHKIKKNTNLKNELLECDNLLQKTINDEIGTPNRTESYGRKKCKNKN